jgi:hypothetical protein
MVEIHEIVFIQDSREVNLILNIALVYFFVSFNQIES